MIDESTYKPGMAGVDSSKKKSEGLSEYSLGLVRNTRELLAKLFPNQENIQGEGARQDMAVIQELIRTCVMALLKDMSLEERVAFTENPGDIKNILRLTAKKSQLLEEEKVLLMNNIDSLTPEDLHSQSPVVDKLDLLDLESTACRMGEALYKAFKGNREVVEAHAFLNLTEK